MHNPANLIAAILFGVQRNTAAGQVLMPGFSSPSYVDKLSDAQVADISNFVLAHYGNPEVTVSAGDVAGASGRPPAAAGRGATVDYAGHSGVDRHSACGMRRINGGADVG